MSKIVDMHLWVLVCMFLSGILVVYTALGMASLAVDGLWNDKLNRLPDIEYGRAYGCVRKARNVCCVWNNWIGTDCTFLDL